MRKQLLKQTSLALSVLFFAAACSGGGGDSNPTPTPTPPPTGSTPTPTPTPPASSAFTSNTETARFLTQATFGANSQKIDGLTGTSPSEWFVSELAKTPTLHTPIVQGFLDGIDDNSSNIEGFIADISPRFSFLMNAIDGDDELRQRVAFALSEILVISLLDSTLSDAPRAVAYYQDILTEHALGNYRDLLEEVTYSPAMGHYLTYLGNKKADPASGRMPDENYAREIMQLFTIGLVELNQDGSLKVGADGEPIETYDNDDITELAKVFTGLSLNNENFRRNLLANDGAHQAQRMVIFENQHSDLAKSFLTTEIPTDTLGEESIVTALDALVNHENTAPFVSHQLIQRLVTSNPSPDYIQRVSGAFAAGQFTLPNGEVVGDGRRGDLAATVAAILFDDEARNSANINSNTFGKIREPIIRFIHWSRAFDVGTVTPASMPSLWHTGDVNSLGQQGYGAPSVFNFFRPGYVPPGTESGAAELTVPELQIINAASIAGYVGTMNAFIFEGFANNDGGELVDTAEMRASFRPDYSDELALADSPSDLIDHLDIILTNGQMSQDTKDIVQDAVSAIPNVTTTDFDGPRLRVYYAVLLVMTSPDYIVQR
ncbi:DUF1800 domain-containing protein [Hirschia maritima]|uniref:DUF1800 domain-containing protein n=1 Tax=Hirschia maritima TaxID=1121961 RepID=UPI00037F19C1|nr:DUF1800 family protein [Hirschia maritima]